MLLGDCILNFSSLLWRNGKILSLRHYFVMFKYCNYWALTFQICHRILVLLLRSYCISSAGALLGADQIYDVFLWFWTPSSISDGFQLLFQFLTHSGLLVQVQQTYQFLRITGARLRKQSLMEDFGQKQLILLVSDVTCHCTDTLSIIFVSYDVFFQPPL